MDFNCRKGEGTSGVSQIGLWCLSGPLREQARSHIGMRSNVGAGLLAKNDNAVILKESAALALL